jgi:superfamily I DNA/RNA helicase
MLVVTFTNAAASEMRLRLSAAIRKRMAEHPEDAARMRDQLARMYRAYISTIDSFALRVIREFFHEIDMEPNFTVADEVRCELLKREAVSELMEDGFANDSLIEGGSFREFLRLYSEERTEENFMSGLIGAYGALRTMPDYFEWAYNRAEQLRITPDTLEGSALQKDRGIVGILHADAELQRVLFEHVPVIDAKNHLAHAQMLLRKGVAAALEDLLLDLGDILSADQAAALKIAHGENLIVCHVSSFLLEAASRAPPDAHRALRRMPGTAAPS